MPQAKLENGVSLEYEVHGDTSMPVILVILGITDNITDWPPGLTQPLVDQGFCLVRYELRDSGLSSKFDQYGVPNLAEVKKALMAGEEVEAGYTGQDMAEDAALLMDYLSIPSAHVIGYSYGAMVAQLLALNTPQKVLTLTCLQGTNYDAALPERTREVDQAMQGATRKYDSKEQEIEAIKNLRIATNGSVHAMNEVEAQRSAVTSTARMYYPHGTLRIVLSRLVTEAFHERIKEIKCPVLVLHGDEDPIFSIEHGEDLARRMPNARLVVLNGVGHNHPQSLQPVIIGYLVQFLERNSQ